MNSFLLQFTWFQLFLAAVFGLSFAWYFLKKNSRNLPPGPLCLPLIGNLHSVGSEMHTSLLDMSKKYGDIYRLYLGKQLFIVVSGKKLFSKMFVSQSEHFSKRPKDFRAGQYLSKGKSFIFTHDISVEEHKKQKFIAMAAIKKSEKMFTMTNVSKDEKKNAPHPLSCLETIFCEEAIDLGQQLVKLGEEYDTNSLLETNWKQEYTTKVMKLTIFASIRSLCPILLGKKLTRDETQTIADLMRNLQQSFNTVGLFAMFPILEKYWKKPLNIYANNHKSFERLIEEYIAYGEKKAKKEKNDYTNDGDLTISNSVLDIILEMKSEGQYENWNDLTTLSLIQGIFGAGFDTFSVLSRWFFVYFGVFPDQTKRARDEVDKFVDNHNHLPRYSDRYDLPYVMAYLTEVVRQSCFMPFTVPHSPVEDTIVDGYVIPKEANILFNFMSLNYDPEVWGDQFTFRPERFLTEYNSFNVSLADKVNVHGAGRRVCAGTNLSRIQDFVSIASLLHTFECKPLEENNPTLPPSTMRISLTPKVFNVRVYERQRV